MDMQTPGQPTNTTLQIFSRVKTPFQVDIKMEQGPKSLELIVQMLHLQEFDKYKLKINQEKLSSDTNLAKYYEEPGQLFNQLKQSFDQIDISNEGIISFEVVIGKTKKRLVKLELEKQQRSKDTSSDFKTLWKQSQKIRKQMSEEIKKLTQTNVNQAQQIQKLRSELQQMGALLKEVISQQKKQAETSKISMLKIQQEIVQKFQGNSSLDEGMAVLSSLSKKVEQQSQFTQKQLQQVKGRLGEQITTTKQIVVQLQQIKTKHKKLHHSFQIFKSHQFQINDICAHTQHEHNNCFNTNEDENGDFRIQKTSSDKKWQSFIISEQIKDYHLISLRVQAETQTSEIMVGICTNEAMDEFNLWKTTYAITFDFRTSSVWISGKTLQNQGIQDNLWITHDQEIILNVNTKTWSLKIFKNHEKAQYEQLIRELSIPEPFRGVDLFFFVALSQQGDAVKILAIQS